jgi:hypothetical protein
VPSPSCISKNACIFFRNLSVTKQTQVKALPSQLSDLVYDQRLKNHHNTSKGKGISASDQGLKPIQCQTLICIGKDAVLIFCNLSVTNIYKS